MSLLSSEGDEDDREFRLSLPQEIIIKRDNVSKFSFGEKSASGERDNTLIEKRILARSTKAVKLLYKGRKYDWKCKVNFHVHILEHSYADAIEVVAYNTVSGVESEHIFVNASTLYGKIDESAIVGRLEIILAEYEKLKLPVPDSQTIKESVKKHFLSSYIMEHLSFTIVQTNSTLSYYNNVLSKKEIPEKLIIDVRDSNRRFQISHRMSSLLGSSYSSPVHEDILVKLRRISALSLSPNGNSKDHGLSPPLSSSASPKSPSFSRPPLFSDIALEEKSVAIPKPETVDLSEIKRFGKSVTAVGEVVNLVIPKAEEILMKVVQNIQQSSAATHQTSRILNSIVSVEKPIPASPTTSRSTTRHQGTTINRRGTAIVRDVSISRLTTFQKFKNDILLLQSSLSYLHISDWVIYQAVSKKWKQALSQMISYSEVLQLTSRQYYLYNRQEFIKEKLWKCMNQHHFPPPQPVFSLLGSPTVQPQSKTSESFGKSATYHDNHNSYTIGMINSRNAEYFEIEDTLRESYRYSTDVFLQIRDDEKKRVEAAKRSNLLQLLKKRKSEQLSPGCHPNKIDDKRLFVLPSTILSLFKMSCNSIIELSIHDCLLNMEFINSLSAVSGKLEKLSLGINKIDDSPISAPQESTFVDSAPAVRLSHIRKTVVRDPPHRPSQIQPSSTAAPSLQGRSSVINRKTMLRDAKEVRSTRVHRTATFQSSRRLSHPKVEIRQYRYMNVDDLKLILHLCGDELKTLELSLTVGVISSSDLFRLTPKLESFVVIDSLVSYKLNSCHNYCPPPSPEDEEEKKAELKIDENRNVNMLLDSQLNPKPPTFDGNITSIKDLKEVFCSMCLPELLVFLAESHDEAYILLDKGGKIIVVNEAFNKLFGYSSEKANGTTIQFLSGTLTSKSDFEIITNGLKSQVRNEEITTALYNHQGFPLLCQMILLPNILKFQGMPLKADCLSHDYLTQLAYDYYNEMGKTEKRVTSGRESDSPGEVPVSATEKQKSDWKINYKELSLHIIRIGVVSDPFLPYYNLH
jgi:PAS domain S-box-containing protein